MDTVQCFSCGTAGSVNVMTHIRRLVPGLRPGAISNRPLSQAPSRAIVPAEISQEMIDWGRQIAAIQLMRAACRHLPGLTWIDCAWRAGRALSGLRRGHVTDALRCVPVGLVFSAFSEQLLDALPRLGDTSERHEAVILFLAAVAWATRVQDDPGPAPLSSTQRALLGSLKGVRLLSGVWSAISHGPLPTPPDPCGTGYCIAASPGARGPAMTGNQTTGITMAGLPAGHGVTLERAPEWPSGWMYAGGSAVFPGASAKRSGGRGAPPRPARPKAAARPVKPRTRTGIKVRRTNTLDRADANERRGPQAGNSDRFLIRGAARNGGAMAGHAQASNADSARESMMGPLSHSSSAVFKARDQEDRRRAEIPATSTTTATPFGGRRKEPGASRTALPMPAPAVPPATFTSVVDSPRCLRFHDGRKMCRQLRALREQSTMTRYCIHPRARERFTNMFSFAGAALPGADARTIAHPIQERIPKALRTSAIQIVRRPGHPSPTLPSRPAEVGHNLVFSVITIALLEGPVSVDLLDHRMSLLRNTFRLMEHVDIGGSRHLLIAYLIASDQARARGVAAGVLDVQVDEAGALSVRDEKRDWTIGASDLDGLVAGLQDVSGLDYDPGPEHRGDALPGAQRGTIPEPAGNLWVTEEEQLSWMPPHDRLPHERTLSFINPVVIPPSAQHAAVELYANSFTLSGDCLLYADEKRIPGVLRLGCPTSHQAGGAILHCPTPPDEAFARRFGLQAGYAYNLEALADQLEARGMVRVPGPDIEAGSRRPVETSTALDDLEDPSAGPAMCPACFTFEQGVLRYADPHGQQGALVFDRAPEHQERYVLGDMERPQDRAFAYENGFDRLRRYTEDEIVMWLAGEGYERVDGS